LVYNGRRERQSTATAERGKPEVLPFTPSLELLRVALQKNSERLFSTEKLDFDISDFGRDVMRELIKAAVLHSRQSTVIFIIRRLTYDTLN
jgi:hypothetical protein